MRIIVSFYDNRYLDAAYALFQKYFRVVPEDQKDGFAYMALCCYELGRHAEFLKYLKKACHVNPKECRLVLSQLFPEDIEPKDYYGYISEKMK